MAGNAGQTRIKFNLGLTQVKLTQVKHFHVTRVIVSRHQEGSVLRARQDLMKCIKSKTVPYEVY